MEKVKIQQKRTVREAKAMEYVKAATSETKTSGKHTLLFGSTAAMLIFVFAAILLHGKSKGFHSSVPEPDITVQTKIDTIVSEKTEAYLRRNRMLLENFKREVDSAGEADYNLALSGVNRAADQLTGLKVTAKICLKMAKDIVCKSSDVQEMLTGIIRDPVLVPCVRGNADVKSAIDRFELSIRENRNRYYADLAQYLKDFERKENYPGEQEMQNRLNEIYARTVDLAMGKASIALGLGVEAICIRSTIRLIHRLCGHIAHKLAVSATTGAIAAAADGPLPIGDIAGTAIFVGGAAISVWDIHQTAKVLPDELRSSMHNMITQTRYEARREALRHAEQTVSFCERETLQIKQQLN